jgi:hypothetical protein
VRLGVVHGELCVCPGDETEPCQPSQLPPTEIETTLQATIVGGALFERPMVLYLPGLLPTYCALLACQALGGELVSPERADELFPTLQQVAFAMPVDLDDATLSKWLRVLTGVEAAPSTAYYKRPEDCDLIRVCAPTAIAGAATLYAHWRPVDLGRYYDALRKVVEHSTRLNPSWQ